MSTEVTFRLASATRPVLLVPVFVNGKGPYEFALDTGATTTILSVELARSLGIEGEEKKEGVGAGGRTQVSIAHVASLGVGAAKLENLQVAILDLNVLSQAAGAKLNGIIGYNYLKNFRVTIDYPQARLRLELPATALRK